MPPELRETAVACSVSDQNTALASAGFLLGTAEQRSRWGGRKREREKKKNGRVKRERNLEFMMAKAEMERWQRKREE